MESHQHNNRYHNETHQQDNEQSCEAQPFCCDDEVVISIEEKIQELPPIAEECCIYRVPQRLIHMNPPVYTPQIISIGPFHHGQKNLVKFEQHKLRFLHFYLRLATICVDEAFEIARTWEKQARRCYAEPIYMDSNKFVEMMLLDGCFIVGYLIILSCGHDLFETGNRLDTKYYSAISLDIYRDLTMLENQLPFFVLQSLFDTLSIEEVVGTSLLHLAHVFLSHGFQKTFDFNRIGLISTHEVKHLVDLSSFNLVPLSSRENSQSKNLESMLPPAVTEFYAACVGVTELCAECVDCVKIKKAKEDNSENNKYPPTVTELHEAGVKIRKAAKERCLMDISFKNGVLEIPPFEIDDCYESTVRNIMAYEHYNLQSGRNYVIQYISFLDYLISTKEDARILVKKGIITNNIGGSNEEVAKLFNDLCKGVIFLDGSLHFDHISQDLQNHCKKLCNQWMASLRHNYCSTPWATISICAAIFLLLLTFLQTLFSILSFQKT